MRSNYRRIGDHIRQIKVKNAQGKYNELLGINIDKFFMPSVANTVGTDLTKYKVVEKGQFACNRMHVGRDYRIPIALSQSPTPFIVSPAYTVFEVIDESELLPEYLMMWFSRAEFDRNAWFHTDADVRGGLPWGLFCDITLPIPSIETQRAIVAEYNTVVNRIELNEQLNQQLEATAQAIYKHWFEDFEFPDENGEPYKSSGGSMVYNEELEQEIPEGWETDFLSNRTSLIKRGITPKYSANNGVIVINQKCVRNNTVDLALSRLHDSVKKSIPKEKELQKLDILINSTGAGTLGRVGIVKKVEQVMTVDTHVTIVRGSEEIEPHFLGSYLTKNTKIIEELGEGSTGQTELSRVVLGTMPIIVPPMKLQKTFAYKKEKIMNHISSIEAFLPHLLELKDLLLSKMSKI